MFVQVIQGHVKDPDRLEAAMDRWVRDLAPGADGWVGSTGGVTDDGEFVGLACFRDAEAARRNSDRPEQDRWWSETSKLFDGEVTFHDSESVMTDDHGDRENAHFVQIIQGRGDNPERAMELMTQDADKWAQFRPEILAETACGYGDGEYTVAVYFTDEEQARAGERKQPPPELAAQMAEMDKLNVEEPHFFDLHHPWIHSPR